MASFDKELGPFRSFDYEWYKNVHFADWMFKISEQPRHTRVIGNDRRTWKDHAGKASALPCLVTIFKVNLIAMSIFINTFM